MKKDNIADKVLRGEDLKLTDKQKENAIKKEKYYADLYKEIFSMKQTRDFPELCNDLVKGYHCMMYAYKDKPETQDDIQYIIKFAFRDFFLLLFMGNKKHFDESKFLQEFHKKNYFSNEYVTLKEFEKLIDYCEKIVKK